MQSFWHYEKKPFPCFFDNLIDQSSPADFVVHTLLGKWRHKLSGVLSRRKSFAVQINIKLYMTTNVSSCFSLQISRDVYVERKDIRVIDVSASVRQNCLLHLSLAFRVLCSRLKLP